MKNVDNVNFEGFLNAMTGNKQCQLEDEIEYYKNTLNSLETKLKSQQTKQIDDLYQEDEVDQFECEITINIESPDDDLNKMLEDIIVENVEETLNSFYEIDDYSENIDRFNELEIASKPLVDFLKKYYNSMTKIVVSENRIEVLDSIMGMPLEVK